MCNWLCGLFYNMERSVYKTANIKWICNAKVIYYTDSVISWSIGTFVVLKIKVIHSFQMFQVCHIFHLLVGIFAIYFTFVLALHFSWSDKTFNKWFFVLRRKEWRNLWEIGLFYDMYFLTTVYLQICIFDITIYWFSNIYIYIYNIFHFPVEIFALYCSFSFPFCIWSYMNNNKLFFL